MPVKRRFYKNDKEEKIFNSWMYDFYDVFGKRHKKSGFKTKAEAEQKEAIAKADYNKGLATSNDNNMKFKELMEQFIKLHAEIYLKPSTVRGYKDHFNLHLKDFFGEIKLVDITPVIINRFMENKLKEGLSNKTVNHLLTTLGTAFNWAINNNYMMYNPVSRVKKLKVQRKEMEFLTEDEIKRVLDVAEKEYPDFYPILITTIYSGMRRGEVLGLTWDCVDFNKSIIKVRKALYKGVLSTPKTDCSIRDIQVPSKLIQVLKQYKKLAVENDLNLVFTQKNGKPLDADNLMNRRYRKILKLAGVKQIRFHDLRHTYASLLISKDLNIKYIQKQMGHSSFEVTMNTYAHLMPEVYEKSKQAIDKLI